MLPQAQLLNLSLSIVQIGSLPNGTGWSGVLHGDNISGGMPNHLMLVAWPTGNGDEIATSFRYSPYVWSPGLYGHNVNDIKVHMKHPSSTMERPVSLKYTRA